MTDGVVAEIEIVPFPTPALIIPIPDTARALLNVPDELEVVFPDADREIVEKTGALFEIVIVLRLLAMLIPAPATSDALPVEALRVNAAPAAPDAPLIVIVDKLL